jgi:hypothetical protein
MGQDVTPDDYEDCDDGTEPPKHSNSYFVLEVEELSCATERGGDVIYIFVEPTDTIAKMKKKIEKHPDASPIGNKLVLSRTPYSMVQSVSQLKVVGNFNLDNRATLAELRLSSSHEEIPKLYATTMKEQLQVEVQKLTRSLAEKKELSQQLRACNQETALVICDDIHMKYKEMENQLKYTRQDLQAYRKKRLDLEKLQAKVTRQKQSRSQQLTRKLQQATYDLRRVQGMNASFATEIQQNYYTFQNPLSWLLGERSLFTTPKDSKQALHHGHFEKGMQVWVRMIGESEYRIGRIDSHCHHPGGEGGQAGKVDAYDIVYDDGEREENVTRKRIRQPNQEIQGEHGISSLVCGCKGCGNECHTGEFETCCGPCNVCGRIGSATAGERMAKKHGLPNGNFSMRERAAVDPYPLAEQWLGNQIDEPSMEQVLQQFYHNMLKRATRGDAHIEFVSPAAASVEVKQKWEQIESGQLTLVQLNQELARRFGGNDLNSVFEPILEPMNRAGFCCNVMGNFHGKELSHHTHLGIVERTV